VGRSWTGTGTQLMSAWRHEPCCLNGMVNHRLGLRNLTQGPDVTSFLDSATARNGANSGGGGRLPPPIAGAPHPPCLG